MTHITYLKLVILFCWTFRVKRLCTYCIKEAENKNYFRVEQCWYTSKYVKSDKAVHTPMKVSTIVLKRVELQSAVANIFVQQTVRKFAAARSLQSLDHKVIQFGTNRAMRRRRVIACCTLRHLFLTPQRTTPHHNIHLLRGHTHGYTRKPWTRAHSFAQICFCSGGGN